MSITKLRVGQEAYTLAGVAQSLDDYYTGVGEISGVWLGTGAGRLGLVGEVAADDLRAVMAGIAPGSGGLSPNGETIRSHPRRVPGFDLTWKVPKSVSVLYGVSDDPRVQAAIIEAGDTAVEAALGWVEREAIRVRRGTGNEAYLNDLAARDPNAAAQARIRSLKARGVVAASFRHRTSRAGDPLLHWHVLVPNLVEGPDGRWSALVHPDLYAAMRAGGEVFQTVLRAELTARLGVEWRPGRHVPEIAGVPQRLCELFSKRSAEIDAWLDATGTPADAAGRQAAVLATRRSKPEVEHERFDAWWKAQAVEFGWGPDAAETLLASTRPHATAGFEERWTHVDTTTDGTVVERVVDPEEWIAGLCRDLTESDATFTRPRLVQAVAAGLGDGATMATVERMVARTLASAQLIPVADDTTPRWTSRDHLEVERRLLDLAHRTRGQRTPVRDRVVRRVVATLPTIGDDQAAALATVAGSTDAVTVLVGPAGTGKTFTLKAVRDVFEQAGYQVTGVAPSGKAADQLEQGAGITASTMHRLLGSWGRGYDLPTARSLLVIDEAGMAGTRELEAIVTRVVSAGGRVLLVGDHRQLPEVTAGGGFAALATEAGSTVAELSVNHRQRHVWEQVALRELRDGHVARAVDEYRAHDRVAIVAARTDLVDAGVDRWFAALDDGWQPVLMAGTNELVAALNAAVRTALIERRALGEPIDGEGRWAVGERLMIRRNNYQVVDVHGRRTRVLNGQTATLLAPTIDGVVVRMDRDHSDVVLPADALADGGVGYGYATTAHRAQGGTWDLSITVGLDGLYREAAYVALSRGQETNWLVATDPELEAVDAELARHDATLPLPVEEPDDVDSELVERFTTSRAKLLALSRDPHADTIDTLATSRSLHDLEARAADCRRVEHLASAIVGIDPDRERAWLARLEHAATHVAVGQRIKAADRRNIGNIIDLDDHTGTVEVRFVSTDGRTAERTMRWDQVSIIDPRRPNPRTLTATAATTLQRLTAPARDRLERWGRILAEHGVGPDDAAVLERAGRLAVDRAAAELAAAQPDWLTTLVGERPTQPAASQVWDDAVAGLAAHRVRHNIVDPTIPTGPDTADVDVWAAASAGLVQARVWLDSHTTQPSVAVTRTRSVGELRARRVELDTILAAAPPDVRGLLARQETGDALAGFDTAALLDAALAAQGVRRRWILEHWPHIVEHHEIRHTLDTAAAGPDPDLIVGRLATSRHPDLAVAAEHGEAWLITLAAQLVAPGDALDASVEHLLADVAGYRQRWDVTGPEPLGQAAIDIDQASERTLLTIALDHHRVDLPATVLDHDPLDVAVDVDVAAGIDR